MQALPWRTAVGLARSLIALHCLRSQNDKMRGQGRCEGSSLVNGLCYSHSAAPAATLRHTQCKASAAPRWQWARPHATRWQEFAGTSGRGPSCQTLRVPRCLKPGGYANQAPCSRTERALNNLLFRQVINWRCCYRLEKEIERGSRKFAVTGWAWQFR